MLLRAVVQVALDRASLGVAGLHDAGARRSQLIGLSLHLVERLLERGVELHVVQREPDLSCQLGERLVVGVVERCRPGRAVHDQQTEELARVRHGRDAHDRLVRRVGGERGQPHPHPRGT